MSRFAFVYQHDKDNAFPLLSYKWQQVTSKPFNHLIVSWNAERPHHGYYAFFLRIRQKNQDWSSWLPYAQWGTQFQQSFSSSTEDNSIQIEQDTLHLSGYADEFQVQIEAQEGANLAGLRSIYACAADLSTFSLFHSLPKNSSPSLEVPKISQMVLNHPRHQSLCSPTSLAAVLQYLRQEDQDVLSLAEQVWDANGDIFGNWVFNIAQASASLGPAWRCWAARLNGFEDLMSYLTQQIPVIVSVKGSLPGSPLPYAHGHLLVIRGYDSAHQQVLCMDPAFSLPSLTYVAYPFQDFIKAWGNRYYLAYLFKK